MSAISRASDSFQVNFQARVSSLLTPALITFSTPRLALFVVDAPTSPPIDVVASARVVMLIWLLSVVESAVWIARLMVTGLRSVSVNAFSRMGIQYSSRFCGSLKRTSPSGRPVESNRNSTGWNRKNASVVRL